MDKPARPDSERTRIGRAVPVALAVIFVLFACYLVPRFSPYAGGADSSGYLNSARLLAEGKFAANVRAVPGEDPAAFGLGAYRPLGFTVLPGGGEMVPTYPIGLPLHLAAAAVVVGWHNSPIAVNLGALLAGGLLCYGLGRRIGLDELGAGAATMVLWACPLVIFSTVQPMSDLLALTWSLAALYCVVRTHESTRWSLIAGFAAGVAVLVRPTNAMLVLPMVVALGTNWRGYLGVGLGGIPAALLLLSYNNALYGSPFLTGYGDAGDMFELQNVTPTLAHYGRWFPQLLSPLVLLALFAPLVRALRNRASAVLLAWLVSLGGLYAFYYHTHETWWYLRFVLPVIPVIIVFAVAAADAIARRMSRRHRPWVGGAVAIALLLFALGYEREQTRRLGVLDMHVGEKHYPQAADWARANLPPNAVVLCLQVSGAFFYYTDFVVVRWDQIDAAAIPALHQSLARNAQPLFAALYDFETKDAQQRVPAQWTKIGAAGGTTFWRVVAEGAAP